MAARDNESALGTDRRESDKWHLKKEISLGDVIAIVVAITAVLAAYAKLDTRVALLELGREHTNGLFIKIDNQLDRLGGKIDRLIERNGNKP